MPGPISRIAHFFWLGPNPIPASAIENVDRFTEISPGWKVKLWDNAMVAEMVEKDEFIKAGWEAHPEDIKMRVMVAKLGALYLEGGVAIDLDVYAMRPFDPVVSVLRDNFFATHSGQSNACVFGSVPSHSLIKLALKICAREKVSTPNKVLYLLRDTWPRSRYNMVHDHYFCPIKTRDQCMEFLRKFESDQVIDLRKRMGRCRDSEMPFAVHMWGTGYKTPPLFGFPYPNEPTNFPPSDYEFQEVEEVDVVVQDDGQEAGVLQKIKNAAGAVKRVVKAVVKKDALSVSAEEVERRLTVCQTSGEGGGPCHYLSGATCKKCGCILSFKHRLATESCPIGRWIIIFSLFLTKCIEHGFC